MARETRLPLHVQLRLSDSLAKAVDDWRRQQSDIPTRSESIRRLITLGLGGEPILSDLLAMMERLPREDDMGRHIEKLRELLGE